MRRAASADRLGSDTPNERDSRCRKHVRNTSRANLLGAVDIGRKRGEAEARRAQRKTRRNLGEKNWLREDEPPASLGNESLANRILCADPSG